MELAALPKIDLHCHLDGSVNLDFMRQALAIDDMEELRRQTQVEGTECESLAQYLKKFHLPLQCLVGNENLREVARSFVTSLVSDHVIYAEVRFSPALLSTPERSPREALELVLDGLQRGREEAGIPCNAIVCAMRGHTLERNREMFSLAREFLGCGVCAVDLAGNEAKYPVSDYHELFAFARRLDIPFTIHAGECGSRENIRTAIELGSKRIGHGLAMSGDLELQKLCVERGVGIELCPTSNLQTKAVDSIGHYPVREFLDYGLLATVNTDNRTVSNTTMANEFALLRNSCGLTIDDFQTMTQNAVACSFASETEKKEMRLKVETEYQILMK